MSPAIERDEELLTAYLDGEVSPEERATVEAWLLDDPAARRLLDELARVRTELRQLPEVEPPVGFLDPMGFRDTVARGAKRAATTPHADGYGPADELTERRQRRDRRDDDRHGRVRPRGRRSLLGSVAAVVAVAALALVFVPAAEATVPPVHDFMARHEGMVAGGDAMADASMPMAPTSMTEADAMGGVAAMPTLGGMSREHVYTSGRTVHVVYRRGDHVLSVYEQKGRVQWTALPSGGASTAIATDPAWEMQVDGSSVMVVTRGAEIYTVVGDSPHDEMMRAATELPAADTTIGDRVGIAVDALSRQFSF